MPTAAVQEPWDVIYYAAADGCCPVDEFLDGCPAKISAMLIAVLDDVADAPPQRYSGGGRWEAMHGDMSGTYEVRAQGPGREQFRLFCILENGTPEELARRGLSKPAIAVIAGLRKPWMTAFGDRDYAGVGGHVQGTFEGQAAQGIRVQADLHLLALLRHATHHTDPAPLEDRVVGRLAKIASLVGRRVLPSPVPPGSANPRSRCPMTRPADAHWSP